MYISVIVNKRYCFLSYLIKRIKKSSLYIIYLYILFIHIKKKEHFFYIFKRLGTPKKICLLRKVIIAKLYL